MFSIGEFSKLTQLTVKTLRFYHEEGLLIPAFVDPDTGYRYYDQSHLETALVSCVLCLLPSVLLLPFHRARIRLRLQDRRRRIHPKRSRRSRIPARKVVGRWVAQAPVWLLSRGLDEAQP
jgi:hypothetical protein